MQEYKSYSPIVYVPSLCSFFSVTSQRTKKLVESCDNGGEPKGLFKTRVTFTPKSPDGRGGKWGGSYFGRKEHSEDPRDSRVCDPRVTLRDEDLLVLVRYGHPVVRYHLCLSRPRRRRLRVQGDRVVWSRCFMFKFPFLKFYRRRLVIWSVSGETRAFSTYGVRGLQPRPSSLWLRVTGVT